MQSLEPIFSLMHAVALVVAGLMVAALFVMGLYALWQAHRAERRNAGIVYRYFED
jgi:uncharacterized membrane protein YqjE